MTPEVAVHTSRDERRRSRKATPQHFVIVDGGIRHWEYRTRVEYWRREKPAKSELNALASRRPTTRTFRATRAREPIPQLRSACAPFYILFLFFFSPAHPVFFYLFIS